MKAFPASVRTTMVLAVVLSTALVTAQTQITPPNNSYTAEQDVQLGREASAQVRQELPILHDDAVTSYVQDLGRQLVSAIPPELQLRPRLCRRAVPRDRHLAPQPRRQ